MEMKRKDPCDFVKFKREGNKAVPYCTYGSYRNIYFGIDRTVEIRISDGAHLCPFLWSCPHQGQVIPIAPLEPDDV
jgi:hypothetical protein